MPQKIFNILKFKLLLLGFLLLFSLKNSAQVTYQAGGVANAFILNYPASFNNYSPGITVTFKANHTINGPASIDLNSLGVVPIKTPAGADLNTGDIQANQFVTITYDGTNFQMVSASGNNPRDAIKLQGKDISPAAPGAGQVLTWNNISSMWEPQAGSGVSEWSRSGSNLFPVNISDSVGLGTNFPSAKLHVFKTGGIGNAFNITSSSTGKALQIQNTNGASTANALDVGTTGSGTAIFGYHIGSGSAGIFQIDNNASNANSLVSVTNGVAKAGYFQINNSTNTEDVIQSVTNGSGNAIAGLATGVNGRGGYFNIADGTNSYSSLLATTSGTGIAGEFAIINASSGAATISGYSLGAGQGLFIQHDGTGMGGHINITNAASSGTSFYSKTIGTGIAGLFEISNATNTQNAIEGITNGTGTALYAENTKIAGITRAIHGKINSISGFGGYFEGRGFFSKAVGIGSDIISEFLQVENTFDPTSNVDASLISGNIGTSSFYFGDNDNHYMGAIKYNNSNNSLNIWTNNIADRMVIDASGNVGVGMVPSGGYLLEVNGRLKTAGVNETSDKRFKEKIVTVDNALSKVLSLRGVNYYWNSKAFPQKNFEDKLQLGLIAQEVETVLPEVVHTDAEGFKSVEYSKVVAVLIEAMKEQQKLIDQQKFSIKVLQDDNSKMKAEIDNIKINQNLMINNGYQKAEK